MGANGRPRSGAGARARVMWRADAQRIFTYREFDELDELEGGWAAHYHACAAPLFAQVAPSERGSALRAALESPAEGARAATEAGLLYGMLLMPEARRARRVLELLLATSPPAASRVAALLASLVEGKLERMSSRSRARVADISAWLAEMRVGRVELVLVALVRHVCTPLVLVDCRHTASCPAERSSVACLDSQLAAGALRTLELCAPSLGEQHGLAAALLVALLQWQRALISELGARGAQADGGASALCAQLAAACARLWADAEGAACASAGPDLLRAAQPPAFAQPTAAAHAGVRAALELMATIRSSPRLRADGAPPGARAGGWASAQSLATVCVPPPAACRLAFLCTRGFEPGTGARALLRGWYAADLDLAAGGEASVGCLVRYVCACVRPTNAMLGSAEFMPRWALLEWLLAHARSEAARAESAHALFADWLRYEPRPDSIMGVEPGALLLLHWATVSPWRACELLARLGALAAALCGAEGPARALESVRALFAHCLQLGVLTTLAPLDSLPRRLDAAPPPPHELPVEVQAAWRAGCLALLPTIALARPPARAADSVAASRPLI